MSEEEIKEGRKEDRKEGSALVVEWSVHIPHNRNFPVSIPARDVIHIMSYSSLSPLVGCLSLHSLVKEEGRKEVRKEEGWRKETKKGRE